MPKLVFHDMLFEAVFLKIILCCIEDMFSMSQELSAQFVLLVRQSLDTHVEPDMRRLRTARASSKALVFFRNRRERNPHLFPLAAVCMPPPSRWELLICVGLSSNPR